MSFAQRPVRVTAPAEMVVTLSVAKHHLRVLHTDDDAELAAMINAATTHLDGWSGILGRCLVTQGWRQDWSAFPGCRSIRLPFPDVQSVSIDYVDAAGAAQTLSAQSMHLVHDAIGSRVDLAEGFQFPATAIRPDAVRVSMTAGFGLASDVPEGLRVAILMHVASMYEHRSREAYQYQPTMAYEMLTSPYRRLAL